MFTRYSGKFFDFFKKLKKEFGLRNKVDPDSLRSPDAESKHVKRWREGSCHGAMLPG